MSDMSKAKLAFDTILVINLLRRRLRDGKLLTYNSEAKFYAKELGLELGLLRAMAEDDLKPVHLG